jgi:hypothetical protein
MPLVLKDFSILVHTTSLTVISAPKLETIGRVNDGWFGHPRLVFGTTSIQVAMAFCFLPMKRLLSFVFCYGDFHIICICTLMFYSMLDPGI